MKTLFTLTLILFFCSDLFATELDSNAADKIDLGETSLLIKSSKQLSFNELRNSTDIPSEIINSILVSMDNEDANNVVFYVSIESQSSKKGFLRVQSETPPGFPVYPEIGDTVVVTYTRVEHGMIWEYRTEWEFVKLPNGQQQWVSSTSRTFKGFDESYFIEK